ncbi:phage holin family protein [Bacillus sp. S70]|uniref:phage holin family protein n=1 Tax=unclassified Bacillus (in: firmicutes) TaxID=185979 RepID=UPI00190A7A4D|nr:MULTISPECIES: phage holin family protein [unclassified Bacillus (in: firmicutes)]MBJ9981107.1 phage holin family protein [Bacillus sp. S29]MBK0103767.1 phage holin family protein [Bacillus sp. S70]MBK0105825.1 phage holin family protein [Bacillus sp. S73]MBK0135685.1 phage holin family protein [Bacillus sp. S72]MBK0151654.1 phage holin family protein [Bacillus sp. S74]
MERVNILLKFFITAFGGYCEYFLGEWDTTLKVLVIIVAIDYITGVFAAGYNGKLKSKVGFKGIAKKVVLFLFVTAATLADAIMRTNSAIRKATINYLVFSGICFQNSLIQYLVYSVLDGLSKSFFTLFSKKPPISRENTCDFIESIISLSCITMVNLPLLKCHSGRSLLKA